MNMRVVVIILLVLGLWTYGIAGEKNHKNYELTINGKTYSLNLEEKIQVKDKAGKRLSIMLKKRQYLEFSDKFVSFQHQCEQRVSLEKFDAGVYKILVKTDQGNPIKIQVYSKIESSMLTPLVPVVVSEAAKESREDGYKVSKKEDISRQLTIGKILKGVRATLKRDKSTARLEVLAYGKQDVGVIVVVHRDNNSKSLLDLFWKTLKFKF